MKIMIRCTTLQPCVYLPGNRHGFLSTTTTTATASAVRREGALDDAAPLEVIQSAHEATLHHRRLVQQLIIAGLPLLGITAAGLIVVVGLIVVRPVGDCSVQLVFAVIGLIQAEQEEVEPFPRELLIRGICITLLPKIKESGRKSVVSVVPLPLLLLLTAAWSMGM